MNECTIEAFYPGPTSPHVGHWIATTWGDDLGYLECIAEIERIRNIPDRPFSKLRVISTVHEIEVRS